MSRTDDKSLAIGMLNACRTQLDAINAPIVPKELNQLHYGLECSEAVHGSLVLLENLLEGDIFEENTLIHQVSLL